MPNHVTHKVTAHGPRESLDKLLLCFNEEGTLDFQRIIPRPEVLEDTVSGSHEATNEQNIKALAETGFLNWYDWSITNWGTKWSAYDGSMEDKGDHIAFGFDTAWSTPDPIWEKLTSLLPDVAFHVLAFDEGWWFGIDSVFAGSYHYEPLKATNELYEKVYGRSPDEDDEEEELPASETTVTLEFDKNLPTII